MSGAPAPEGRIWLVDDDAGFRESVGWWLEGLGHEVLEFDAPQACLDALTEGRAGDGPACFLLDVRMPQMTGLQLLDALRTAGARWPVVFMTGHGDVALAVEAMRKGALTFLEKPFKEAALEEALAQAFAPQMQAQASAAEGEPAFDPELQARLDRLTPREREIMDLLVEGRQNKMVAADLGISPKTVELHRARVMAKMEAASLPQLVRMAISGRLDA